MTTSEHTVRAINLRVGDIIVLDNLRCRVIANKPHNSSSVIIRAKYLEIDNPVVTTIRLLNDTTKTVYVPED